MTAVATTCGSWSLVRPNQPMANACSVRLRSRRPRRMPQPDLDFYGATRRLEETSARRLALGLTLLAATLGYLAGVLPIDPLTP